jgi:methyl-accepting chemotaxis protein
MKSPAAWWSNTGLQFKLQVLIQGFLLAVLLIAQHWFAGQLEERALTGAHQRAVAMADSVINSLNTLMVTKLGEQDVISDPKARALFIEKMGFSDDLKELRVIRGKGTSDEFGPGLPQEQPVDELDQQVLRDARSLSSLRREDGSLRTVLPFVALKEFRTSKCLGCHAVPEGSALGAVSITTDVSADLAHISELNRLIWVGQAVLQVLLLLGIRLIVRRQLRELGAEPRDAARLAKSVAGGDLTAQIPLKRGDTHSMMAHLLAMQQGLTRIVAHVRRDSEGVAAASSEIAQGNQDLAGRTERQACALEETAATMEELAATVQENAGSARAAKELAANASAVAVKCGDVVGRVVSKMKEIDDSSRQISSITAMIDTIAFQTNILSLNAAVEAARAGEQGRGFAVVASEVRRLAASSAEAAKEIKRLIGGTVTAVGEGTALADSAAATMSAVVESIGRVAEIMTGIAAASAQQAGGLAQVGQAVQQMDQATQQNAAMVEQLTAAASSLKALAAQLVESVRVFKLDTQPDALVDVRRALSAGDPRYRSAPGDGQSAKRAGTGSLPLRSARGRIGHA